MDLKKTIVPCPEWNWQEEVGGTIVERECKVEVRELSLLGKAQWREYGFEPDPKNPNKIAPKGGDDWLIYLALATCFDPDTGERALLPEDLTALKEKSDAAVTRLLNAAWELNEPGKEATMETANFTSATPKSPSPAESPPKPESPLTESSASGEPPT